MVKHVSRVVTVCTALASSLTVGGCASNGGVPGMSGLTGSAAGSHSNGRQKAALNACEANGTCEMSERDMRRSVKRAELDEQKSLADWKTRKRGEDARRDELKNDGLESDVRRRENENAVGAVGDTIGGYSRAAGETGNLIQNVQGIFK